jgi:hypothetical protein
MSKQTNAFQQLMHYIYGQMVPEGATVTESALLKERNSDSEREVDILIEYEIAGTEFRLAVECRDRSRKDSIDWIDGLIGKYRELDIDRVVAVNRLGFSEEAVQKANANRIQTRSLEKALHADWIEEFTKLGIAKLTYRTFSKRVRIETEPPLSGQAEPSDSVVDQQGNVLGTLSDAITDCFKRRVQPDVRQYIQEHFFSLFETLADLKGKVLVTEQSIIAPIDLYITDAVGEVREIRSLDFHTVTVFSVNESIVENYAFGEAQITSGGVEFEYSDAAYNLDAVQIPGREHGKLFVEQRKKKW